MFGLSLRERRAFGSGNFAISDSKSAFRELGNANSGVSDGQDDLVKPLITTAYCCSHVFHGIDLVFSKNRYIITARFTVKVVT
jgi:hypothetical protein